MTADAGLLDAERNMIREGGAVGRDGAFIWMANPRSSAAPDKFAHGMVQWAGDYFSSAGKYAHIPGARGSFEASSYGDGTRVACCGGR